MDDPTTATIFDFIGNYIQEHGYAPNVREIAEVGFIHRSYVIRYLVILEEMGLIRRDPRIARGIALTNKGKKLRKSRLTPR